MTTDCTCFLDRMAEIDAHPERIDNPHQVTAGQTGTYTSEQIDALIQAAVPSGVVMAFGAGSAPSGWLVCEGSAISRVDYAPLFAVVGETYGAGDGSTTFNLPDLRGEFVRGWDDGRGVDVDRVLGSAQEDALQNIIGEIKDIGAASSNGLRATGPFYENGGVGDYDAGTDTPIGSDFCNIGFDASRVARTADETRPRNVAFLYCIKA
ncbi:phage tail protein [Desulfovibrio ferrophilus]|uniref:Phage Tail Collar Domain protein n=1 Tax=Desulfovibrio ferrophilus TaxID=241368 RepID=A0A2Z6AZX8_9BACT|nr:phage tail protein [Desulfovibrio ferrophilus]BBD08753.1 phage Tail Collar Domain protein [Desulfovibrio ferrophilus]